MTLISAKFLAHSAVKFRCVTKRGHLYSVLVHSLPWFCFCFSKQLDDLRGAFTNYVDKTRQVGGTVNVNGMQIFPYFSKEIPSQISTGGGQVVNDGHNLVNVVYERPLIASRVNLVTNGSKTTCLRSHAMHILSTSNLSFSSCQRNLIKTFQIEGMIALITKMTLIFSSDL